MPEPTVYQLRTRFRKQFGGVEWPSWPDSYNEPTEDGIIPDGMLWWTDGRYVAYVRPTLSPGDLVSVWKVILTSADDHRREGPERPWAVMDSGSHRVVIVHQFAGEEGLKRLRDQVPAVEDLD